MENKQTAIQQLINEIVEHLTYDDDLSDDSRMTLETIRLRCLGKLSVEKEQIIDSYKYGNQSDVYFKPEQYYIETYESKEIYAKDVILGYKTSLDAQMLDKVEPKQETLDCPFDFTSRSTMGSCDCKPKQETLEEAAEIFVNNRFAKQISGDKTYPDIHASKEAIIESHILFAKWQQENIIEELEMHILVNEHDWNRNPQAQFRDFVEQFKKK
jgi:hypothetical protein